MSKITSQVKGDKTSQPAIITKSRALEMQGWFKY